MHGRPGRCLSAPHRGASPSFFGHTAPLWRSHKNQCRDSRVRPILALLGREGHSPVDERNMAAHSFLLHVLVRSSRGAELPAPPPSREFSKILCEQVLKLNQLVVFEAICFRFASSPGFEGRVRGGVPTAVGGARGLDARRASTREAAYRSVILGGGGTWSLCVYLPAVNPATFGADRAAGETAGGWRAP